MRNLREASRSLVQVLAMPTAGSYNWNLDSRMSGYKSQFNYWQVYFLRDGATIDLVGGPRWAANIPDARRDSQGSDFMRNGSDDELWHGFSETFAVSEQEAEDYDSIAFVMTGSRHPSEILGFTNLSTTVPSPVPEPCTLVLLASGGLLLLRRCAVAVREERRVIARPTG